MSEIEVKALEWRPYDSWISAETVVGRYTVRPSLATNFAGQWILSKDMETIRLFPSDAAAQAAAQSDFEARIRSALVDRKAEPVAWTNAEQLGFLRQFDNPMAMWGKERAEFGATIPLYSTPPAAPVRVDAEALERLTRFSRGRPKVYEGQPFDCDKLIKADVRHVLSALSASPSPVDSRDGLIADEAWEELCKLTFAVQHNPNCRRPWLVRLPGKGPIDMKPYADGLGFVPHQTGDILGFGTTLIEAARAALAAKELQP